VNVATHVFDLVIEELVNEVRAESRAAGIGFFDVLADELEAFERAERLKALDCAVKLLPSAISRSREYRQ
jgi:hypothetical protein